MRPYNPRNIRGVFRKYPILARIACIVNLMLYPVIIPIHVIVAGCKEVGPDIKGGAIELLSAAFLPWREK